jgi:uncharacterized protein
MGAIAANRGHVMFPGDDTSEGVLEGVLEWPEIGPARAGLVLAHPHPLHGATMAQPVIYRCAQACRAREIVTLRFNFRGVEQSTGVYSGFDEYRDVVAAASFLRHQFAATEGYSPVSGRSPEPAGPASKSPLLGGSPLGLGLLGYSFGSVMCALAVPEVAASALVLVGFVVASEWFPAEAMERLRSFEGPVLAITAEHDDLAPPDLVDASLDGLGIDYRVETVEGTDHFFEGRQREVAEIASDFLAEVFG